MAQAGFTPISLYYSSTAAAAPTAGNLAFGELALNILDGKLYFKNSIGVVTLLSSSAIAGGAFTTLSYSTSFTGVGPATITDNSANAALRVTQTGAGNALLVEDSANPDATPFVIDAIGNVVIGGSATTPGIFGVAPLLSGLATGNLNQLLASFRNDVSAPFLTLAHSRGTTIGSHVALATGDLLGQITFSGSDGTQFIRGAQISSIVDTGTVSVTSMPARMLFYTTPNGSNVIAQRMEIDSNGSVGIGATGTVDGTSLVVTKPITGPANSAGVRQSGAVDVTSTTTAYGFINYSQLSLDAGTISSYTHYGTSQGTLGTVGTVLSAQYAFSASALLIGATSNIAFYALNTAAVTAGKTAYGFYTAIDKPTGGGTTYGFYGQGDAPNYMLGVLGLGSTPINQVKLAIGGTLTGAVTSYGMQISATVQPDVTSGALGINTSFSTSAVPFSTSLVLYQANQGTIGNGSIVTTQYAYVTTPSLIGATTNYGFYANLPKPTVGATAGSTALNVSQSGTTVTVTTTAVHNLVNGQVVTVALTANATALVTGVPCTILTVGTTDFTLIGAASNTVGVSFTATGAGTGTGTVTLNSQGSGKVVASAGTVGVSTTFTYTATSATFAAVTVLTGAITIAANWNLYLTGTADNYMAGALGIGTVGLTGYTLRLGKTITGASNAYGVYNAGQVQSDVGAVGYFVTAASTAASTSLTTLDHYSAGQGTFSGTSVTNQRGFRVNASLVGATNNFGFFSEIPESLNDWNFYASGTANNYMAGRLWLGTTSAVSVGFANSLDITGASSSSANSSSNSIRSGVTASATIYNTFPSTEAASFTLPALYHFQAGQGTFGAGSTVTAQYAYFSNPINIGATSNYGFFAGNTSGVTAGKTAYGFYSNVNLQTGGGTTWGFYGAGSANNFMSGSLWLGNTSPGLIGFANYLDITGGTVAYGNVIGSIIRSPVTSSATMNFSIASTEAVAFTLASLTYYSASQGTFANTGVTSQIGFLANTTLISASNNYGFYGNIPAGTNRFNLYCAGTAENYMAGRLGIGGLPSAGQTLYLGSSITGNVNSTAVRQQGTVDLASVTTSCFAFDNVAATTATAATLPTYVHYNAQQGTFGAGSTVTSQLGFNSAATLIGATTNVGFYASNTAAVTAGKTAYGFYSAINVQTGGGTTWGFYGAGNAPNFLNGTLTVPSMNGGGQLAGLRNKIINGKMAVWQRGASISCPAATTTYTADRFYVNPTGAAVTVTQNTGQTNVFQATLRVTGAASVTAVAIGQRIEATNIADLSGSILATVTLSWYAAASALTTMGYAVTYPTVADTAPYSTAVTSGSQAITSTLTRYSKTFTMPAGAVTGLQVQFTLGAFASGTFDISGVQLEIGSVPTPLEQRPIGMELALCQRYTIVIPISTFWGSGTLRAGGTASYGFCPLPVQMRTVPAATPNTNTVYVGDTNTNYTSLGISGLSSNGIYAAPTFATSAGTVGQSFFIYSSASAVVLSAEL